MAAIKSVSMLTYVGNPTISGDNTLVNKKYVDTKFGSAASTEALGTVKPDGTTITISNGVISAKIASVSGSFNLSSGALSLKPASDTVLGGVKVGAGLTMTDGVLSNDYSLPTASASTLGGVKVGAGLSISDGVLSNAYTLPTASSSTKGGIKIAASNSEFTITNDVMTLNVNQVKTSLGLGTAAYVNTGTASGNVPVLDSNGKLNTGVIPSLAITDTFTAANQTEMLALSAQKGDICIRTDENKTYILTADGASTLANWKALATPTDLVTSVAGRTGAVTLTVADIGGTSTSISSSSTDAQIPTAKAVYSFVTGQGYLKSAVTGIKLNSGTALTLTSGVANIPAASSSAYGVVQALGAYDASDWSSASSSIVASAASVKGFVEAKGYVSSVKVNGTALTATSGAVNIPAADASNYGVVQRLDGDPDWTSAKNTCVPDTNSIKGYLQTLRNDTEITGDGTATEFTITHPIGEQYVMVQVVDKSDNTVVLADVEFISTTQFKVKFAAAPASGAKFSVMSRR